MTSRLFVFVTPSCTINLNTRVFYFLFSSGACDTCPRDAHCVMTVIRPRVHRTTTVHAPGPTTRHCRATVPAGRAPVVKTIGSLITRVSGDGRALTLTTRWRIGLPGDQEFIRVGGGHSLRSKKCLGSCGFQKLFKYMHTRFRMILNTTLPYFICYPVKSSCISVHFQSLNKHLILYDEK